MTTIILLLKFCRWYVADRLEKPAVVKPIDPFERCKLHRLNVSPRTPPTDHLGFVEPDDRFREGIIVRVSRRSHRGLDAALGQPLTVADGQILRAPDGISVAEAVLGTIEAFFATSLQERITPYRATARIVAEAANNLPAGLRVTEEKPDGEVFIRVQYAAVAPSFSSESRMKYRDGLMDLIPRFIAHTAVVDDIASYLARIAGEERGFSRALLYSEISLAQDNLFGSSPKVLLRDWIPPEGARRFPLMRTSEWYKGLSIKQIPLGDEEGQSKPDLSDPSTFFRERAATEKHSDRKIASQIDIPLWNQAGWCAVFYLFDPRIAPYPVLGLGFRNKDAAEKIFQGWRKELGPKDKGNALRITILKGIERDNPAAYRVFVSTNIAPGEEAGSLVMMVGRRHTMTPETTENLDSFLESIKPSGQYLLVPAHFKSETELPGVGFGLAILKGKLTVRHAWEVSLNELDAGAFGADDDPFIPPDVKEAPVSALLAMMRSRTPKRG